MVLNATSVSFQVVDARLAGIKKPPEAAKSDSRQPGRAGRTTITTETYTLIGLGVATVVVVWLVYSVFRKVFGLVLVVAVAAGAWVIWSNPELLQSITSAATGLLSSR